MVRYKSDKLNESLKKELLLAVDSYKYEWKLEQV